MPTEIIQMKITLDYIKPAIWRKFIVASSISLADLHTIIQVVMGWEHSHLYSFHIRGTEYKPSEDRYGMLRMAANGKKLSALKLKEKDTISYVYDFGDNWEHTIKVEKIYETEEKIHPPFCLDGARACPPEDCGSVPGYERILEAMKKPKSKESKELLDWLGDPFDAEDFDVDEINAWFKPAKKAKAKR